MRTYNHALQLKQRAIHVALYSIVINPILDGEGGLLPLSN